MESNAETEKNKPENSVSLLIKTKFDEVVTALERTADAQPVPKTREESTSVLIQALLNPTQSPRVLQLTASQGLVQRENRRDRKKNKKSKQTDVSDHTEKFDAVFAPANASSGLLFGDPI